MTHQVFYPNYESNTKMQAVVSLFIIQSLDFFNDNEEKQAFENNVFYHIGDKISLSHAL